MRRMDPGTPPLLGLAGRVLSDFVFLGQRSSFQARSYREIRRPSRMYEPPSSAIAFEVGLADLANASKPFGFQPDITVEMSFKEHRIQVRKGPLAVSVR